MTFYGKLSKSSLLVLFLCAVLMHVNAQQRKKAGVGENTQSQTAAKINFIAGKESLNIPFDLSNNLVLLQAQINDSKPLWFILDTGAESTVIDSQLAKDLGLKSSGKDYGNGAAGTAEAAVFKKVSLHLPNIEALNQTIYGLPIDSFSASFGKKISGIIGLDILKKFVVEIDYASRIINFYESQSYRYSGDGEILPFTIGYENLLFIPASIEVEGRERINGNFELDSGSTGALLLNSPFVNKNRLLKSIAKTKHAETGGVGGSGNSFIGRIKNLRIGKFTIENPITHFYQDTKGDNASARYDGLIGGSIFRRFEVIFDFPRRQMTLKPNAQIFEAFEIDMSGMTLIADGDDLSVVLADDVEANSPAAEAGIQGGDIITAIEGRSTKEITLDEIHKMFRENGKEYLLSIKRGEKQL